MNEVRVLLCKVTSMARKRTLSHTWCSEMKSTRSMNVLRVLLGKITSKPGVVTDEYRCIECMAEGQNWRRISFDSSWGRKVLNS